MSTIKDAARALLKHMRDTSIPSCDDFTRGYRTDKLGPLLNDLRDALATASTGFALAEEVARLRSVLAHVELGLASSAYAEQFIDCRNQIRAELAR